MPVYTIEIAGDKNEYVAFSPTMQRLRGRWDNAKVSHRDKSDGMKAIAMIHYIPGIYVSIDTTKKVGRTYDPLKETKEGQDILAKVTEVYRQNRSEFGDDPKPWAEVVVELTNDTIKDWLWAMRSAINGKHAIYAASSPPLPELPEISKLPGKRTNDPFNTGPKGKEIPKFTDIVPEKGEKELAGAGAGAGNGPQK